MGLFYNKVVRYIGYYGYRGIHTGSCIVLVVVLSVVKVAPPASTPIALGIYLKPAGVTVKRVCGGGGGGRLVSRVSPVGCTVGCTVGSDGLSAAGGVGWVVGGTLSSLQAPEECCSEGLIVVGIVGG